MTETKITETTRWTRTKFRDGGDWIEVDCFCFTAADGSRSYADGLFPEQLETFKRQQAVRLANWQLENISELPVSVQAEREDELRAELAPLTQSNQTKAA